jgi:hypothetical protein
MPALARLTLAILLTATVAAAQQTVQTGFQQQTSPPGKPDRLQERTRLEIVRFVSGEFARAVKPLPSGKDGIRLTVGKPIDDMTLRRALGKSGMAAGPGDRVQITEVRFGKREIFVDINGGGKKKKRFRDRIQIGVGGIPTVTTTPANSPDGFQGLGATIVVDFGRPVPDVSPDELKNILGGLLDFSRQRSATVDWVSTLEPEFQQAIRERRAVVGMDREMVIAAMGRPERKIRERTEDGLETEDWIYGDPPGKTVFVTFAGEKVIRVKEFPK